MRGLAGDEVFDAALVAAYPRLLAYARVLTGSLADAQDVLQEAMVRCIAHQRRSQDVEVAVAYLRRAVTNEVIRHGRRRSVVAVPDDLPAEQGRDVVALREDLRQMLTALTPRERVAVVCRHYLGLTEKETARDMGCTVGTVKKLCSRALAKLRQPTDVDGGTGGSASEGSTRPALRRA